MLNSILFHWIGAHILVKGNITITDAGAYAAARKADEKSKQVRFKKFLQFRNRMSETTQIDNVRDIYTVMSMYNFFIFLFLGFRSRIFTNLMTVEEGTGYFFSSTGILWQYYRNEPNNNIADFGSFSFKQNNRKCCCWQN